MTLQALKDGDWLTSAFWASMLAICFASVWVLHRVVGRIR
jgi:hypothetical protein